MKTTRYIVSGLLALACAAGAGAQQAFPNKPIRLVVGFAPGGNTDTVARVVGAKLGERLGTQVIIDNRGGAGGTIGTEIAARANSDGYTLTMGTTTTHAIAVAAYPKLRYDPVKDFEPIALVAIAPYLLVVNQNVPMKSLKEFISHVQSQPGKLNYASAGQATTTHLVMATLQQRAKLDMMHVPFKGNGPATAAVLGGIGNIPGAMLGGMFLGLFESVGPTLVLEGLGIVAPYQLKDVIAFTMLVMVLIFRPSGILGERLAQKKA